VQQLSRSPAETQRIASQLSKKLKPNDCLALEGQLGSGKTQFVRGLIKALGGNPRQVSSPTFVLLNVYPTPRLTVYHLDAYRIHGSEDFSSIGFSELLDQNGIVVVEWASKVKEILPPNRINILIEITAKTHRRITIANQ